jgi:hypothetical protein
VGRRRLAPVGLSAGPEFAQPPVEEGADMNDGMFAEYWELYQGWSRTLTSIAYGPWRLLASQCEAGFGALDTLLAALRGERAGPARTGEAVLPGAPAGAESLEQRALERVRQGLSPPREIYAAPHRDRIDWARFPDWARPIDPEVFEGSGHEG